MNTCEPAGAACLGGSKAWGGRDREREGDSKVDRDSEGEARIQREDPERWETQREGRAGRGGPGRLSAPGSTSGPRMGPRRARDGESGQGPRAARNS